MSTLKSHVAIVTGGSRGIGRAIVLKLASLGCDVAFSYHHSQEQAQDLESQIKNMGVKARASLVDVKDFQKVKAWIDQIKNEFGRIDILINNAGIIQDKTLMLMTEEDWCQVIDTNLTGMFNTARACIVPFLKQKKGHIINISSVSGIFGLSGQANYSASKGGMNAFTRALAKEVSPYGIRVNAICPGYIDTDILSGLSAEKRQAITDSIPWKRLGQAEEVANVAAFLLSESAAYITGQLIVIDGGLTMR